MRTTKILTTIVIVFFFGLFANGQNRKSPKRLKVNGDYLFKATNFVFPTQLETYQREGIYSFDMKNTNLGVVYERNQKDKKTKISIYIYPAGVGVEGRLRNEYLSSLRSIANLSKEGLYATQFAIRHEKKYLCYGFKAVIATDSNEHNQLTLFECGTWFLKVRLTTNELDSIQISKIEDKIFERFDPSKLTEIETLNLKADINLAKIAFRDSTMLHAALGSAVKKIEWAFKNVNENERVSGFPDLYLQMHIESLKAYVSYAKEKDFFICESTQEYLDEINSIINAGFLEEFIMEQFKMIMIFPENFTFDFEGFDNWKLTNKVTIDLNNNFYVVSYGQN